MEERRVVGLEDQVSRAGGILGRLEMVAGRGEPGVEKDPAHGTQVFRIGHRPALPVIEEVEKSSANVEDGLRLRPDNRDGVTDCRPIDGPLGFPGWRRIGRLDPEGQRGHDEGPGGESMLLRP
jgi:hypothetical protein